MPLYEYECRDCGKVTDIRHGFKETTNESCPACGGVLRRRFNPAGIVFKGSGFYVTDSRKTGGASDGTSAGAKSDAPAGESKSEASPGESKSGASSTESKGESTSNKAKTTKKNESAA